MLQAAASLSQAPALLRQCDIPAHRAELGRKPFGRRCDAVSFHRGSARAQASSWLAGAVASDDMEGLPACLACPICFRPFPRGLQCAPVALRRHTDRLC